MTALMDKDMSTGVRTGVNMSMVVLMATNTSTDTDMNTNTNMNMDMRVAAPRDMDAKLNTDMSMVDMNHHRLQDEEAPSPNNRGTTFRKMR
jgi:hypothetical protein